MIADQVLSALRAGTLQPGEALPAERELAQRFGVSRSSVREAIRALEQGGVVEVRTGSGTYITADAASRGSQIRVQAAIAGDKSPLDIIIARQALEPSVAAHAAMNRRPSDLEELAANIQEQAALIREGADVSEVDSAFHLALARATHNPVFVHLVEQIVATMRQSTWSRMKGVTHGTAGNTDLFLAQHQAIFTAVEAYDAGAASSAMLHHLRKIEQELLAASQRADHDDESMPSGAAVTGA